MEEIFGFKKTSEIIKLRKSQVLWNPEAGEVLGNPLIWINFLSTGSWNLSLHEQLEPIIDHFRQLNTAAHRFW